MQTKFQEQMASLGNLTKGTKPSKHFQKTEEQGTLPKSF